MYKRKLPMLLQLFAEGGDGGQGGQGGGDTTNGQGGGNTQTTQPFAVFPDEASFLARVKREGKSQLEAMAKELGFESVEAMQAAAKAKKDADEAAKTELEKAKEAQAKAEQEKKAVLDAANKRIIDAELKLAAQAAGFVDPADALALVDRSGIKVDDSGVVTGAKEAVDALAKAKPHLLGQTKPGGTPGSGGNGGRQSGGGQGDGGFAEQLAKKRAAETKKASEAQSLYFK